MTTPADALVAQSLFDSQFGLATQSQLLPLGFTPARVRHFVESGSWQAVLRGVYALSNGRLTREATLMAALLYGGANAVLSHTTAAEEWGMRRVDSAGPIHITVPYGQSAKCQTPRTIRAGTATSRPTTFMGHLAHPGVRVHRSRAHRHIIHGSTLPRTGKADTAIDLAVAEPTPRGAYVSLISTVTNGRIPLQEVRRRLEQRSPYRYRKALASAVRLLAEGVQSVLEYHYTTDVEVAHGLPVARRQSPVVVDGRTLYEDCDYSEHGVPLIVRLDGRWAHSMREVAFRDRRRDNAAELSGRPRLTYGFDEVTSKPCVVAGEVEAVLVREGWRRTTMNNCPACESFPRS